jgi:glucose/arabinose dehydrogenase
MMRQRWSRLAALAACAALGPACGEVAGLEARRVIASPSARDAVDTTVSPPAPTTVPLAATDAPRRSRRTTVEPAAEPSDLAQANVRLRRIATLDQPLAMALRRDDGGLYIAEKGGRIRVIRSGKLSNVIVLDISTQVSNGGEQGLLGLAFHPDGSKLYVNFTNTLGDTIVREYAFSDGRAQTATARTVLEVDQPFANHNGGNVLFGPDGYLYIGLGDGGSGGDPQGNGQNIEVLLGKMLRIDPVGSGTNAYTVPGDNPFVGREGRDEIWAYGLRNPWRYTFDRVTGDLWTGDVGQNAWEEVDFQRATSQGGENYGWNRMEGNHSFAGGSAPPGHRPPIYEFPNGEGNCAVTGGYVYRGSRIPDLRGAYLFADFCAGQLRAFIQQKGRAVGHRFLGPQTGSIASFGEDRAGELYVLSLEGGIFRIDPAS